MKTVLNAKKRETNKKTKKLLAEGRVPGCVYGFEDGHSEAVSFRAAELRRLKGACAPGTLVTLAYGLAELPAVIREATRQSAGGDCCQLSVQLLSAGKTYDGVARVVLLNRERASGYAIQLLTELPYTAAAEDMTDTVVFDLNTVSSGSTVFVRDLSLFRNEKVKLNVSPDMPVAAIHMSKIQQRRDG